jgi:signal transduction histidine kinase
LTVQDDGLGFPPDEAHLMFEKFHRLGDEQTRKTPGTGLGLYIVRRLAELSGAEVSAASSGPGQGATLTLTFRDGGSR